MKIGVDYIGVGCGALIVNENGETLLLKRSSNTRNEAGFWSKPGGGVEFGEEVEEALKREVKEELGVDIGEIRFLSFTNSIMKEDSQHWVSLNYCAKIIKGEPKNLEPHKHEEIKWFKLDQLPEKVNPYTLDAIKEYLNIL
jgi:ADP-ribose pyrophosphatase